MYIESWGFWFVTKSFSVCEGWSHTRSSSDTNLIFSFTFIKVCLMLIQNDIYCWIKTTTWIEIEEFPQYKFYNNIGDLPVRSFWYHSIVTKRNPWVCCVHIAQLMTHPAIYTIPFTLQLCYNPLGILQRVTKSQKAHISSHDGLQKLHSIKFVWHMSQSFPERLQKISNFPLPQSNFLRTKDLLLFKQRVYYSLTVIRLPHKYLHETLISHEKINGGS